MGDNFEERIKLTIDDSDATAARANKGLQDVEKQAVKTQKAVSDAVEGTTRKLEVLTTQSSKNAINRVASAAERRALFAGADALQRVKLQTDLDLKRVAGDQEAINRVVAAGAAEYKKLEEAIKKAAGASGLFSRSTSTGRAFLGVKDLFEGRTSYAEVEFATAASKLGGGALIGAGVVAGVVALGTAILVSTKHLHEYAVEQLRLKEITGLSANELASFSFAAKQTGTNIDVVERLMRGLSSALNDGSAAGDKARDAFKQLGIAPVDLNGNLKPTGTLLLEISDAFSKMPAGTKKAADAIDLFKRLGIDVIPFLNHLRDDSDYFKNHSLTPITDTELSLWQEWGKALGVAADNLGIFIKRYVESPLAIAGQVLSNQGSFLKSGFGALFAGPEDVHAKIMQDRLNAAKGQDQAAAIAAFGGQGAIDAAKKQLNDYLSANNSLLQATDRVSESKKKYEEAQALAKNATIGNVDPGYIRQTIANIEVLRKGYEAAKENEKRLQALPGAEKSSADAAITAQQKYQEELRRTQLEAQGLTDIQVTGTLKIEEAQAKYFAEQQKNQREGTFNAAVQTNLSNALRTELSSAALQQSDADRKQREKNFELLVNSYEELDKRATDFDRKLNEEKIKNTEYTIAYGGKVAQQARDTQLRALEVVQAQTLADKVSTEQRKALIEQAYIQRSSNVAILEAEARAGEQNRINEQQLADEQIKRYQYDAQAKVIDQKLNEDRRQIALTAEYDINAAKEQAAIESTKLIIQEDQRLFGTLKQEAGGVIDALFSHSKSVFAAIGNALKSAILTPIKDILSSQIAASLTGLITGQSVTLKNQFPVGNTRLAKFAAAIGIGAVPVFGGAGAVVDKLNQANHLGDMVLTTGGAVPVMIVNPPSGSGPGGGSGNIGGGTTISIPGVGNFSLGGGGGSLGGGGAIPAGAVSSSIDFGGGFGNTSSPTIFGSLGGLLGGPGGTTGFGGDVALGGGPGGTGGGLSGIPGLGGIGGIISQVAKGGGFAASALAPLGILGAAAGLRGAYGLGQKGGLLGKIGGPALGAVSGLLGFGALTALFPALLATGPIGWIAAAGIGAAIGLAGVLHKPMEKQIVERVKAIYGIDISTQFAKSALMPVIQSKFGGEIDVGLRSPELRQLIMLYGAATGGPFSPSSSTPINGSLVEQGGKLYQQSSSLYGTPFALSSSLPTLGGPVNTYPSVGGAGGGPINLSLSIAGKGIADFMTGNVVTPSYVSSAVDTAHQASDGRTRSAALLQQSNLALT